MLKIPSKCEQRYFVRPNIVSPVPPALLLDGFAGRIVRDLWWTEQEFSPVNIIPPWLSILFDLGDEK
jgi:hypothetical protein